MLRTVLLVVASALAATGVWAADSFAPADDRAFLDAAAAHYGKILAALAAKGKLDDDSALLARSRRIAAGLIAAAAEARPAVAAWSWEVHVTTDGSRGTFCIAGGKVLVGAQLVRQLELDDGELAMLLGHEIAHAVVDHRREAARATMDADAAQEVRAAEIAVMQEDEADRIGLGLALRAGWPAASLVSFFDKLAAQESPGTFNSSHPTAAARAATARARARAATP
jgi:predicted Zn-dependent protease